MLSGLGSLAAILSWQPSPRSTWQNALHQFLSEAWPVLVLAGVALAGYEIFVHRRLLAEFTAIAGPRIVEALLPQQVLETFLRSIYGANDANRDVVVGVLGGEGLRPQGGDLTISTHTAVSFELRAVDYEQYHLTSSVTYSFKKNVTVNRFVIFATCNALLRDSISSGCRLPLFELWFIPDSSLFGTSVDDMLPSVLLDLDYIDQNGVRHLGASSRIPPQPVKFDRWADYLTFFREGTETNRRLKPRDHLSDLRIFDCDLSDIAEAENSVSSVERLKLTSTTLQRIDDGYCYWQPPYPCYVDRITIDVKELDLDSANSWEFRVVSFTFRSNTASARWLKADDLTDLEVRSWLLPGHGVALLWRAVNPS
ncbi:hypothetical protein [Amycolatopsis sp.]|uniref:hypothetical protein n=1 Tax=Amycolatopsis sp. TaxID=37632 RepID=UPI00262E81C3|nr:hypothetical protein [Amycolatopsis sp.]